MVIGVGVLFLTIKEKKLRAEITTPEEEKHPSLPAVKNGNLNDAKVVLSALGYEKEGHSFAYWLTSSSRYVCASLSIPDILSEYRFTSKEYKNGIIPDVTGMGAKDAVYQLQKCGLEVTLQGYGTVYSQSLKAGNPAREGDVITLKLHP